MHNIVSRVVLAHGTHNRGGGLVLQGDFLLKPNQMQRQKNQSLVSLTQRGKLISRQGYLGLSPQLKNLLSSGHFIYAIDRMESKYACFADQFVGQADERDLMGREFPPFLLFAALGGSLRQPHI